MFWGIDKNHVFSVLDFITKSMCLIDHLGYFGYC